ncbi:MAG: SpoIIIAH-like family protein [Clostridiales bacterium]|nr:SpoIIIAH-like family protein [Clostridiales bacterium]
MEKTVRNKRFIILLAAAVLLLVGAVILNLKLNNDAKTGSSEDGEGVSDGGSRETMVNLFGDYFNSFRDERSRVRAQEIDYLRSIINSQNTDDEALEDAQSRLLELVGKMEKEFAIESRIRGKGFLDAAATYQGDSVTVIVDGETLTDEEVARILDIVITETGLPASRIKISTGG